MLLIAPESFLLTHRAKEVLSRFGFPGFNVPQQPPDVLNISAFAWWGWVRRRLKTNVCWLRSGTHCLHTIIHMREASRPHGISHVDKCSLRWPLQSSPRVGPQWRGVQTLGLVSQRMNEVSSTILTSTFQILLPVGRLLHRPMPKCF